MFYFTIDLGSLVNWLQLLATIFGFWFINKTLKLQGEQFKYEKDKHKASIRPWLTITNPNFLLPEKKFSVKNKGAVARTMVIIHPNNSFDLVKHLEANHELEINIRLPAIPFKELVVFFKYADNEGNTYFQEVKIKDNSTSLTDPVEVKY